MGDNRIVDESGLCDDVCCMVVCSECGLTLRPTWARTCCCDDNPPAIRSAGYLLDDGGE